MLLKEDIQFGCCELEPTNYWSTVAGDRLLFSGTGGLWVTDGTSEGTTLVSEIGVEWPTVVGRRLVFTRRRGGLWTLALDGIVPDSARFLRGDCNADGFLDVTDPVANLSFQFVGTFDPPCHDALDFDDNGELDVTDPIANLTHQFLGGLPPSPPGKDTCGVDPGDDNLSCDSFAACPAGG